MNSNRKLVNNDKKKVGAKSKNNHRIRNRMHKGVMEEVNFVLALIAIIPLIIIVSLVAKAEPLSSQTMDVVETIEYTTEEITEEDEIEPLPTETENEEDEESTTCECKKENEQTDNAVEIEDEPAIKAFQTDDVSINISNVNRSSYITNKSGLSVEQIGMLIEGTNLSGIEDKVYQIEQEYNVNAIYTLAVASLESGYGTSNYATSRNNIFGLINKSFDSFDECVLYFGDLMYRYENTYNINMTLDDIGVVYCENPEWSTLITQLMNQYIRKANQL